MPQHTSQHYNKAVLIVCENCIEQCHKSPSASSNFIRINKVLNNKRCDKQQTAHRQTSANAQQTHTHTHAHGSAMRKCGAVESEKNSASM